MRLGDEKSTDSAADKARDSRRRQGSRQGTSPTGQALKSVGQLRNHAVSQQSNVRLGGTLHKKTKIGMGQGSP